MNGDCKFVNALEAVRAVKTIWMWFMYDAPDTVLHQRLCIMISQAIVYALSILAIELQTASTLQLLPSLYLRP